jgi:uncharacterized Zn-binding protein involved in type VI secretion
MPPAARVGDNSLCVPHCHSVHPWSPIPHPCTGPIVKGSPNVMICGPPAARLGDNGTHAACCGPNTYNIIKGSGTVMINNMPSARLGDSTLHCGMASGNIIVGAPTVIIGG